MARRVQIIANPIAGGGQGAKLAPELARQLEARGLHADLHLTSAAGDARARARELDPDAWFAVAAVGGDGTINEVANGLRDPSLRLAILPLGTANVLACELALCPDPVRAAEIVDEGHTIDAAVGLVDGDRRFLLFAGYGIDGAMVHRLEQIRSGTLGKLGWTQPVAHIIRRWPVFDLRVETGDGRIVEGLSQVLVTRVRNYGGWFEMPDSIDIRDGKLHVVCFRQRSRLAFARAAFRAWRGALRPGHDVELLETDAVRVTSPAPVPCQVDGDAHGTTPHEITLEASAARILVGR